MIEFSFNIYIIYRSHIYIILPTYSSYKKQQIKLFLSKGFLIDILIDMVLFISFVVPITTRQLATRFLFLSSLLSAWALPGKYKQTISLSSWQLYNPLWVVFQNPTDIYTVRLSSTLPRKYVVYTSCHSTKVLDTYIVKNSSLTVFINI